MNEAVPLSRYFERESLSGLVVDTRSSSDLRTIIAEIAAASVEIAELVSLGCLASREPARGDSPIDLDTSPVAQARRLIIKRLRRAGVRDLVCAGRETAESLDPEGTYSVVVDPLDGSSKIDTNMSLGTIFSVAFAADATTPRGGATQLAAGFIVYGPQTKLVLTLGDGVDVFTLDRRDNVYKLSDADVQVPAATPEYAIDSSNYRHWPTAVRALIDDHRADLAPGADVEPGHQTFNMRWMGSLVAEAYRILMRGGVFLCPSDKRVEREAARQRLLSAAHPIAFVMEQAGARASTGYERILDLTTTDLDGRTPLIFGSRDIVTRIERLHELPERVAERSPLFARRGLFRI